ncbi:VPS9 domain-containing protein 1 isoform X1 [Entelurus aequoreus]|uniref:VPS9 domain-containing protein 1 isoform X1 n=1 Tax=Entelurus aequoreus TaxID=161455 RepID=UPI002B1D2E8C|nr:VPS9 domain-containing protein 1 isoform X1 [Entelurus aequoreus]XP_061878371.1 VPS9 domain-containing protein 1 isoform X1 [Entelurus aequoreus]XP_061878372.1 VPS9 domain-containing protein 1 isoform X1 [Entelurus aequoreus]
MATADVKPLQNAMKMAKTAINLDGGNRHKEAYCEYLRTINYISHVLLEEAVSQTSEKDMVQPKVERMLTLAEQCLERARSFLNKTADPSALSASGSSSLSTSQSSCCPVATVINAATSSSEQEESSPTNTCRHPGDDRVRSPFLPPHVFQRLQTVVLKDMHKKFNLLPPLGVMSSTELGPISPHRKCEERELTPIEEASHLNQKLKANYEARLARLTPGQAYQKTSLTLTLQRQMMENLIIAKARQEALQRKMEETRLRLQEEANRRFAASGAMTPEEQEQRILYTNVLEYEQDHDWPKQWKANMRENSDDVALVTELISCLLSSDHPVVKLLKKQQYRIYNRLYPIVSKGLPTSSALAVRPSDSSNNPVHPGSTPSSNQGFTSDSLLSPSLSHDVNITDDVEEGKERHLYMTKELDNSFEDLEQFLSEIDWDQLDSSTKDSCFDPELSGDKATCQELEEETFSDLEMRALKQHLKAIVKDIHIAIEQLLSLCLLSFECLNTASYKDLCLASIEESFFMPLWSALLALFRKVHRKRELSCEIRMKLFQDVSPLDFGVPLTLFPLDLHTLKGSYPYECAVQELKLLTKDFCPQRKLECIVRTLRLICACAEDYRGLHEVDSAPSTAAIGADDLLPILSFVVLRCQCPQLVSECAALEEFIHEGYLIGEEGYCLTSMQSALAFVQTLHIDGVDPPAEHSI